MAPAEQTEETLTDSEIWAFNMHAQGGIYMDYRPATFGTDVVDRYQAAKPLDDGELPSSGVTGSTEPPPQVIAPIPNGFLLISKKFWDQISAIADLSGCRVTPFSIGFNDQPGSYPEEYRLLVIGNAKKTINSERSVRVKKNDSVRAPGYWYEPRAGMRISLFPSALEGGDLWREQGLTRWFFARKNVAQYILAAGLKSSSSHPCRIHSESAS